MEEEFNHIDEYFRKVLKDYQKESSGKAWKILDQYLYAAQLQAKKGGRSVKEKLVFPISSLLHRPWFRLAIAAAFMLLILFSYALVRQWRSLNTNKENNRISQNELQKTASSSQEQTIPGNTAEENAPSNAYPVEKMPLTQNTPAENQNYAYLRNDITNNSQDEIVKQNPVKQEKKFRQSQNTQNNPLLTNNVSSESINANPTGFSKQLKETPVTNQVPVATKNDHDSIPPHQNKDPLMQSNDQGKLEIPEESNYDSKRDHHENELLSTDVEEQMNAELIIPNVFTPNNDGKNDYFEIVNIEHYITNQLVITNRNGKIIYEKTNYMNDWDASGISSGVYYYLLVYKNMGENYSKRGVVHIYR